MALCNEMKLRWKYWGKDLYLNPHKRTMDPALFNKKYQLYTPEELEEAWESWAKGIEEAKKEAERLAKQFPNQYFYVMKAKALSKAKQEITVETINI